MDADTSDAANDPYDVVLGVRRAGRAVILMTYRGDW
jgi:hypothetical protein